MNSDNSSNEQPIILDSIPESSARSPIPVTPQLIVLGLVLLLMLGGALGTSLATRFNKDKQLPAAGQLYERPPVTSESITAAELAQAFEAVQVVGKAAYVWDVKDQQVLYTKNAGESLPIASLTKLMTALVAHEILEPDNEVAITHEAARQDSSSGLAVGTSFESRTLSDLVLVASSNDGAYALAATAGRQLFASRGPEAFVAAMNVRAEEMGLSQTRFYNPTGLDLSRTEAGAYGSARDIAFLLAHILEHEPDILTLTTDSSVRLWNEQGAYVDAENTNFYSDEIPGLLGSKTGYTDLAGGNLAIAYNAGLDRPVIVVVLGSTQFARFTDVMTLVDVTNSLMAAE